MTISRARFGLFAGSVFAAVALTGCGAHSIVEGGDATTLVKRTMSGSTHGGFNFIGNARITLYAAGTSGFGTGASALAFDRSGATNGTFSFIEDETSVNNDVNNRYQCPSGDPQMYLVSEGGNTSASMSDDDNTASELMTPLGSCSTMGSHYITINEATTVAMAFSMQQFLNIDSDGGVVLGAPNTVIMQKGLANAFMTFNNLVNSTTGTINTSFSVPGSVDGVAVTATVESKPLITLSNILAGCVNQATADADACTNLFTDVVPPNVKTNRQQVVTDSPATVAQAAYYLAINPTQSLDGTARNGDIYNLSTGYQPFGTGGLQSPPLDWTVAISYTAGTTATSTTCSGAGGASPFGLPSQLAIDGSGTVWVTNGLASGNAVAGVSPAGAVTACIDGTFANGHGIVIDTKNNVWYTARGDGSNGSARLMEYPSAGGTARSWTVASGVDPYVVTADGIGDVIMMPFSPTGGQYLPQLYVDAADATTAGGPSSFGDVSGDMDAPVSLSVVGYSGTVPDLIVASSGNIYDFPPSGSTTSAYWNTPMDFAFLDIQYTSRSATSLDSQTVSVSTAGTSPGGGGQSVFQTVDSFGGTERSPSNLGGLNAGAGAAVDGLNHYWTGTSLPLNGALYGFVEISDDLNTPLSPQPSSSFDPSQCSVTACVTNGGFQRQNVQGAMTDTAIDPSGNVWSTYAQSANNGVGNGLVELVGAAVPVRTPIILETTVSVPPPPP